MIDRDVTRRRLLRMGPFVGLTALAGCSGPWSPGASHPKLGRIRVENRDDAPHTVHVLVERDGTAVYRQSVALDPAQETEAGHLMRDVRTVSRRHWGDSRGDYRVTARLDERDSATTDPVDHGAPCELLNVVVHGEPHPPTLSILNAPADEDCR